MILEEAIGSAYLAAPTNSVPPYDMAGTMERMMTEDERGYYERRAEKQLLMATATDHPNVCASHYTLANMYLERVSEPDETQDENAALCTQERA